MTFLDISGPSFSFQPLICYVALLLVGFRTVGHQASVICLECIYLIGGVGQRVSLVILHFQCVNQGVNESVEYHG